MSEYFVRREDCAHHRLFPGVDTFTMAGQQVMLSCVELEPHSVVELHSHPHEQLGMLLEGEVTFTIGDEQRTLTPGDMWRIPGGVQHGVVTGAKKARAWTYSIRSAQITSDGGSGGPRFEAATYCKPFAREHNWCMRFARDAYFWFFAFSPLRRRAGGCA